MSILMKILSAVFIAYLSFMVLTNVIFFFISKKAMNGNSKAAIKWGLKYTLDMTFVILTYFIFNHIVCWLVDQKWNIRWKWAKDLWQTVDAYCDGLGFGGLGQGGDTIFFEKWSTWYEKNPSYWRRVYVTWRWLYRNTAQGFSVNVTGLDRNTIIIEEHRTSAQNYTLIAYKKNEDGSKGEEVGYERKHAGFFFGKGKLRLGYKIDFKKKDIAAMLVSRYLPWATPEK